MGKTSIICLLFSSTTVCLLSQPITCPSPYVYMDGGSFIQYYDPSQPLSSTNPANTNIPTFGSGLTLMPNISGGTLSPTFYSTSGGTYWYWSGASWVNTGHSTGSSAAVNLGGCQGTIYNIVGGSGTIYTYNGTTNGSSLTVLQNFNGGGPYDLVTDCNCNFYALNTTSPNQGLTMYNSAGIPQCTYSLVGMPSASAGGGFAIIGNMIYVKNNTASPGGFYAGTIGNGVVTFSTISGFTLSPGDFASCPVCNNNSGNFNANISGGLISCTIPTANLIVTTTATPVTYNWSGPGIVGATTNSAVVANAQGIYTCVISTIGCPPAQLTLTTSVSTNIASVQAVISPSGNICLDAGASAQLSVSHALSTDVIVWTGPSMSPVMNADTLNISIPGTYSVSVTNVFNGCVGTDMVTVAHTPTISVALSNYTLCAHGYNGSPNTITVTPSGASNYTLLTSSNYTTTSVSGGQGILCTPLNSTGAFIPTASGTLIGSSGFCSDTLSTVFSIVPNPTVTLSSNSGSICPQQSYNFSASGAFLYTWSGPSGLNTYIGSQVIASPSISSVYSVIGTDNGCKSATANLSVTVLPNPFVFLSPSTPTVCLGSSVNLIAVGNANLFTWIASSGSGFTSTSSVISVTPSVSDTYTVVGSLNSCTNSASTIVYVQQPPVITVAMNSASMCAQNFNGSPNFITFQPSGASNYTLTGDNSVVVFSPNGPIMQLLPVSPFPVVPSIHTATLLSKSGVCDIVTTKTFEIIPNPVVGITPASANICPGQSQIYTASGASTYTWLPIPGYTLISSSSIIAKPSITTFYSVTGSNAGCQSSTKNAVAAMLPVPGVTVSPKSATVCAGSPVVLIVSGEGGASYNWSPPINLSSVIGPLVIATPTVSQSYTVVASLNGCTNSAVTSVSAIPIPIVSASVSQPTICSASSTQLSASGAASYNWIPSDNLNTPYGNLVVASPYTSTTYTVMGYNGICTGSTSVFVRTVKRPDMEIEADASQICFGSSLGIKVSGAEKFSWIPTYGLYFNSGDSVATASPSVSTNYTVVGVNSLGTVTCSQQLSYLVNVIPIVKAVVSSSVSLCEGERVTLHASGGNTYRWSPAYGINITNGAGVVANPKMSTIYTVNVSYNTFCGSDATVAVEVNPRPTVYAGRDSSYNINEAIFIRAIGTGEINWVFGDGVLCSACPESQIYPTRDGCYIAQAVNEFGCKATDDVCIKLTEDFTIYIPNSFTPNKDGRNDVFLIYGENIYNITMEVYDRWGTKIFSSNDYKIGWDGTYKGTECQVGIYNYVVTYTGLDRKRYTKTGFISLNN